MRTAKLGDLVSSAQGLGCMGMSDYYKARGDRNDPHKVIEQAVWMGVTHFDTSDIYGPHTNEVLVGRALSQFDREEITIATKFGVDPETGSVRGDPDYVTASCKASLNRLQCEYIDLYYMHRIDPNVPIEETVGAMAELVSQGYVRHIGLCEASPKTIKRASSIHPLTALQTEWSLWSRGIESEILPTCRELGIGIVAYSPLGRGFLSGAIRSRDDLGIGDFRLSDQQPRWSERNFDSNLKLIDRLSQLGTELDASASQLALAWLHHQGNDVVPIPGSSNLDHLRSNVAASEISLSQDQVSTITNLLSPAEVQGDRYAEESMPEETRMYG